ncbi:NUDIX domain-containing protein [Brevibacterium sp. 50QC2O2]|jgi:8-oxo-dGTP diphosphatase|uniref:NUDIX hydrolase n=1 Tax=Brevibacterium TaxID=1696 RepID=UPI00211C58B4|nr:MULTISPECIES: NUDIX domain-containing protein [unclassified Brevibacterium]MCQ9369573.1 NUDIX domain-containing protein [Brevibacterium sp. 91QC2O2]MCQ9386264.1 NUDIX domain-containing protein [Brevibacterium sp. 68QC2CO]MCQ9388655.1 NUDIX domain-containing protein [Brevibacterium sp. 50QC2O2]
MNRTQFLNVSERQAVAPPLAVSTVVFALRPDDAAADGGGQRIWLPLVRRTREPYRGQWALPGGPLRGDTSLRTAAAHTLRATTGLAPTLLEQLYTFGGTDRGIGLRTVSVVYWALVRFAETDPDLVEDPNVAWFPADDPAVIGALAFDHQRIVEYALARLRSKVSYADVADRMLPDTFTLAQLRQVYEAIGGERLDPANFRRTILSRGVVEDTGQVLTGVRNRPPRLYRAKTSPDHDPVPDPEGEIQ